ncbi:hypothetical protein CS063_08315 [Sporanaerobium hydrogeniformans]|uniref:Uncharacterized protein n=1 Tax=Sporanaerobium hydrogeniformans TaxID=3072179 RepID=A0AC61DDN5_9FIRM|nr:D-alanyl-D-alanine carboxypeptidase [Sporanaerobium hydrogeniformans]PHV70762.1 hypothetical protein CS063_08315 [Sporanaerobium hydrogeniformans]
MIKRFTIVFLCLITFCFPILASSIPNLHSEGAILIEPTTNTVLYSKNGRSTFYPASTTKILTALLLIEDLDLEAPITKTIASINNTPIDSSHIGLQVGDRYTALDGLYGILLGSDNFISYDMSLKAAGSMEAFVDKMNQKAKALGATSSHFVNPHGYHSPMHYTTPYDLSQIARGAFSNPLLLQIAGTPLYNFVVQNTGTTISLKHTAALLDTSSPLYNNHVIGVKTGFHDAAKRVLVAKAHFDNIDLIGVVMHTDAPYQFEDMNTLFEYGQTNFSLVQTENFRPYIANHSYSPWAKPYIETALSKAWITQTTRNYTDFITKRELIHLLKSSLPAAYRLILDECITYKEDSIYAENLPATRQQLEATLLHLFNTLALPPREIFTQKKSCLSSAPTPSQEVFLYTLTDTQSMGKPEMSSSPDDYLTYEEAIAIATKISTLVQCYDQSKLVDNEYPYSLPILNFY